MNYIKRLEQLLGNATARGGFAGRESQEAFVCLDETHTIITHQQKEINELQELLKEKKKDNENN